VSAAEQRGRDDLAPSYTGHERRLMASLALDRAAEELAQREGITTLQALRRLKSRPHVLTLDRQMRRRRQL
jgi:hypothetical protein